MGVVQTLAQIFLGINEIDYKRTHVAIGIHKKRRRDIKSDRTIRHKRFVFILFKIKNI